MEKSKRLWWPIITGEKENPEEDLVIGFSVVKPGYAGITLEEGHTLTTKEILQECGGAYSLRKQIQGDVATLLGAIDIFEGAIDG